MNDTDGQLYPANPKMLFKDADRQESRGGWIAFVNQPEHGVVLIKMQIEADVSIASEASAEARACCVLHVACCALRV